MSDKVRNTTPEGREWSVSGPGPASENYPTANYVWGEFAGLAIELGGYNDISAVDPYSGRRFWLSQAFRCDVHATMLASAQPGDEAMAVYRLSGECEGCQTSFFTAARRLLDAMEAAGFPDNYRESDELQDANT